MNIMTTPLSPEEIQTHANEDGMIEAVIPVSLGDLIDNDHEDFIALLSACLTGEPTLEHIHYRVAGHEEDHIVLIGVTADVRPLLAEMCVEA